MAPQKKLDIAILKVVYEPYLGSRHKKVKMVKNAKSLEGSRSDVKTWFDEIIRAELALIPRGISSHFKEWELGVADPNLFKINDNNFNAIYAIFGQEKVHWIYNKNNYPPKRISGSDDITFGFCGCCLDQQYLDIMNLIHQSACR